MKESVASQNLISTRYYTPEDHNFIMATMLRGLYYGDSWFSLIPKSIFMTNYHPVVERLLASPNTIKVACLVDDPSVILGYSVYRQVSIGGETVTILDWVFCKKAWRNIGIAKTLLPPKIHAVSHLTKTGKSLLSKIGAIFNPFS